MFFALRSKKIAAKSIPIKPCLDKIYGTKRKAPLVGFDRHGARLGSGGGYYDRWLSRPRIAHKPRYLGYAYALQQVERLPRDDWDVPLDAVITERGITWALSGA